MDLDNLDVMQMVGMDYDQAEVIWEYIKRLRRKVTHDTQSGTLGNLGLCSRCGTRWTADEPLPCPVCVVPEPVVDGCTEDCDVNEQGFCKHAGPIAVEWNEQDHAHLKHLAEADEPTWMGEIASRAMRYIEQLVVENRSLRDSARMHDMCEELADALGADASESPGRLLSRVTELAESIRADASMYEKLESVSRLLVDLDALVLEDDDLGKVTFTASAKFENGDPHPRMVQMYLGEGALPVGIGSNVEDAIADALLEPKRVAVKYNPIRPAGEIVDAEDF